MLHAMTLASCGHARRSLCSDRRRRHIQILYLALTARTVRGFRARCIFVETTREV